MRVLATYNIKGGVGKTTTAVNLAYLDAHVGHRTLVWDLDPQGAASFYFRVRAKLKGGGKRLIRRRRAIESRIKGTDFEGLDLLPADFSFRHLDLVLDRTKRPRRRLERLLGPLAEIYDRVYIDCAPSISLVSESIFRAADVLLVPTIPTTLSLHTLGQLRNHLRKSKLDVKIWPFFSMVDVRKSLHREICAAAQQGSDRFLNARIPYSSVVERMGLQRAPLPSYAPNSRAAQAYESLAEEIEERLVRGDV